MTRRTSLALAGTAVLRRIFAQTPTFTSEARLVEVPVNVYDSKKRPVDNLTKDRFLLKEDGVQKEIVSFESHATDLSCAVLLDTTGSMAAALPTLKNAVSKFIDEMRESDAIAVYRFNDRVALAQDFTSDHKLAKQAVMRIRAEGQTALFDAIAQVAGQLESRRGKKMVAVFTDGDDNASVLNAAAAVNRAKRAGIPVYAIAQGDASHNSALVKNLRTVAETTGGLTYTTSKPKEVEALFGNISGEVQHTYLITYTPPPRSGTGRWRQIQLEVSGLSGHRIRARESYYSD
jgi:Ca-activated chloride channel family protein